MAVVWIPSEMRALTGGAKIVRAEGSNLRQVINNLGALYPGVKEALLADGGQRIQPTIAVAIDGETSHLGLIEPVGEESEVHFIPAIGGG